MNNLEKESELWFKNLVKQIAGKKAGEDYSKGQRRQIFPGNMLFFSYPNPKTSLKKLKVFDKFPLIILFGKSGRDFWGVNTHFIPKPLKEPFLKMVVSFNKQNIKNDKRLTITYKQMKLFLIRTGLSRIAVKRYKINRIVGLKYIPYNEWKYQLNLPTFKFVRDENFTTQDLEKMLRSALSKSKASKNVRFTGTKT